jgi:hypothetical protein
MKTQRRNEHSAAKPQPSTWNLVFEPLIAQIARMGISFLCNLRNLWLNCPGRFPK